MINQKNDSLKIILDSVENINKNGILARGAGYCFAMSEMIQTILANKGIESKLIEVKLTVMSQDPPMLKVIGHDNLNNKGEIDTHLVCVTETDPPYLIDLSIYHLLQPSKVIPYIVADLDTTSLKGPLVEYETMGSTWIYEEKTRPKLPAVYQQNMVGRIKQEQNLKKQLFWLKILIVASLTISSTNAIRGGYDFYQKYIVEDNDWGPGTIFNKTDNE